MNFCIECGSPVEPNGDYCPNCGKKYADMMGDVNTATPSIENTPIPPVPPNVNIPQNNATFNQQQNNLPQTGIPQSKPLDTMCLVGFILSFFVAIVGLIMSIIGYKRVKADGPSTNKTLAIAGIVISIIGLVISAIFIFAYIVFVIAMISSSGI